MSEHPLVVLPETEKAYNDWIASHKDGYVINAWKKPMQVPESLRGVTWHRADCGHIAPFGTLRYVEGATLKACSTDPGGLVVWAMERGEPLHFCETCRDKWAKERKE